MSHPLLAGADGHSIEKGQKGPKWVAKILREESEEGYKLKWANASIGRQNGDMVNKFSLSVIMITKTKAVSRTVIASSCRKTELGWILQV